MSERVVVCFQARSLSLRAPERANYLQSTRRLLKQARARGGTLIAWGASSLTFSFDYDELSSAVSLAVAEAFGSDGAKFSAGMAQGEIEPMDELSSLGSGLGWGPPLLRAQALASIARAGEVLMDPDFDAYQAGDLLTIGARRGVIGEERLRGQRLDLLHPWRAPVAESVADLQVPLMIGRPDLIEMLVPAGCLGVVRAARGTGGTRFLGELARSLEPARVLRLTPSQFDEPLGALRRGILKARSKGHAPAVLDGVQAESLESLLEGEGLDIESTSNLIQAWLTSQEASGSSGAILIDGVADLDTDSLEAICVAMSDAPFRLIVRIDSETVLPDLLSTIPEGNAIRLAPMTLEQGVEIAKAWTRGELEERAAKRWANRGGGLPLAIAETLAEGIESGELVWTAGLLKPRLRTGGRGRARSAAHWIQRRARFLGPHARALLFSLAVLGGEADVGEIGELVREATGVDIDFRAVSAEVESRGFLRRPAPELCALPSSSHQDAILSLLSAERLGEWHRAATVVLAGSDRPLASASAAAHAILGADFPTGVVLARRAAASCRAVGLIDTAAALEEFTRDQDPSVLSARGIASSVWPAEIFAAGHRIPSDVLPRTRFPVEASSAHMRAAVLVSGGLGSPRLPGRDVLAFAEERPARPPTVAPAWPAAAGPPSTPGVRPRPHAGGQADAEVAPVAAPPKSPVAPEPEELEIEPLVLESVEPEPVEPPRRRPRAPPPPRRQKVEAAQPSLPEPVDIAPASTPPEEMAASLRAPESLPPPSELPPEVARRAESQRPAGRQPESALPAASEPPPQPMEEFDQLAELSPPPEMEPRKKQPSMLELELELDDEPPEPVTKGSNGSAKVDVAPGHNRHSKAVVVALQAGNFDAAAAGIEQARDAGAPALANRLEALLHVARGEHGEALARLRPSQAPGSRIRLALARAVALSSSGRPQESLLDALEGLALARGAGDRRGEAACATFIARLSERVGDTKSAEVWRSVVAAAGD